MNINPILFAIPVFFGLMALELGYEAVTHKFTYRLNDAITNINLGVLNQVSNIGSKIVTIGVYTLAYQYLAIFKLSQSAVSFVILFVLYDLCFYWSHRMSHQISLLWGGHVVHHQSEDFNLSVALRQSSTAFIWSLPFYLPLALMGFHPMQFLMVAGLNLLYQFWIHTEHIAKLGWVELIMNTPSHHRVHHGRDPKYIDKNYAGVFIIWDRLFGTFKEEEEKPTYGITKPLKSWNPVYANFAHYIDLFRYFNQSRSWADARKILLSNPGWLPEYLSDDYAKPDNQPLKKYDADISHYGMKWYVGVQFLVLLGVTTYFLFNFAIFSTPLKIIVCGWIIYSTVILGLLFERQSWQMAALESVRFIFPVIAYGFMLN